MDKEDNYTEVLAEPHWLACRWHVEDNKIYSNEGVFVALFNNHNIAEYIIAAHHECLGMDYAGGQLSFDFTRH